MNQMFEGGGNDQATVSQGAVSPLLAAQIHATIGEDAAPAPGAALPSLWYWCAFPPTAPMAALKADGHLKSDPWLAQAALPRRMWAGGGFTFHKPLHVDEPIERQTRIRSITEKDSKAGPMILVTLDHAIHGADGLAIEERQDIVYLEIPTSYAPPQKRPMPAPTVEAIETTEALLFRYSAVTFNAHRIHYDLRYCQEVEHYPGLVLHGPLQATYLIRAATRHHGAAPRRFEYRGVHPMFVGPPCEIALEQEGEGLRLWTGQDGHQCMQATAQWEDPE